MFNLSKKCCLHEWTNAGICMRCGGNRHQIYENVYKALDEQLVLSHLGTLNETYDNNVQNALIDLINFEIGVREYFNEAKSETVTGKLFPGSRKPQG